MSSSARESSHWQQIRRDVDEDASGLIRRYLRLSEKMVGAENEVKVAEEEPQTPDKRVQELNQQRHRQDQAA